MNEDWYGRVSNMQCQNCQTEMDGLQRNSSGIFFQYWCKECGMLLFITKIVEEINVTGTASLELWFPPHSIEKTKKITLELMKTIEKISSVHQRLNRVTKEETDRIDWGDDDRR